MQEPWICWSEIYVQKLVSDNDIIGSMQVNIDMLHSVAYVDMIRSHVDIIMLHADDMIYLCV